MRDQLAIIKGAMDKLQSDSITLSGITLFNMFAMAICIPSMRTHVVLFISFVPETYKVWSHLLNDYRLLIYHNAIAHRAEEAMEPFHYLAAATDPKNSVEEPDVLPPGDNAILDDWLSETHPEFIAPYIAFKLKDTDYFDSYMFNSDVVTNFSGFKWWSYVKMKLKQKQHTSRLPILEHMIEFCNFVCKLHSIPGSNAGLERIFSNFSLVWTKLRNRFGPEKVDKLVKVHRKLNQKQ